MGEQSETDRYFNALKQQIAAVFDGHQEEQRGLDHRKKYPWLTGYLGNPWSGIWFVGESPSLSKVERVSIAGKLAPTEETQWCISKGDRLFRESLASSGFKEGSWDSPDGWNCYITDIIKSAYYSEVWNKKRRKERYLIADVWSDVLKWELANSKPKLVVAMGRKVERLLRHLQEVKGLCLPSQMRRIPHYAYVASRPCGNRPPMDPDRIRDYEQEITAVADAFQRIDS